MVPKMRIQLGLFVAGLFVFLSISGLFAFALAVGEKSTSAESIRRQVEQETLEDAMRAFDSQDYKKAKIGFEMLSESSRDPEISRQALFGLASAKLALWNTSDEYEDAVSSWKKWSGQASPICKGCEDPRMVTPFLLRLQPTITGAPGSTSGTKSGRSGKIVDSRVILQTKEKEMQTLRAKLDLREREIRRLRHQLESLEEIHRRYQEKKQEAAP